jgi:hypothetical protein
VGEWGVGDWQVLEYDEALDKRVTSPDFPLIVVLLEGQTASGRSRWRELIQFTFHQPPGIAQTVE